MDQATVEYRATLTGEPFLYFEAKVVAALMLQGLSLVEMQKEIDINNLFQYTNNKRVGKRLHAVYNRLTSLDLALIELLASGSSETAKLINFYAIAKNNRLVKDFMREVYRDKRLAGQKSIDDADVRVYLNAKAEQSEVVAKWSESTRGKLRQVLIQMLAQSGLLSDVKKRLIVTPIIEPILAVELRRLNLWEEFWTLIGG